MGGGTIVSYNWLSMTARRLTGGEEEPFYGPLLIGEKVTTTMRSQLGGGTFNYDVYLSITMGALGDPVCCLATDVYVMKLIKFHWLLDLPPMSLIHTYIHTFRAE